MGKAEAARIRAMPLGRLKDLLMSHGNSATHLAPTLGVTQKVLANILRSRGVKWVPWAHRPLLGGITRAAMYRLYVECARSQRRMAARLNVNLYTLRRRLTELGFKRRAWGDSSGVPRSVDVFLTKAVLLDLYETRRLSLRQVGRVIGCLKDGARHHLMKAGIKLRPKGEKQNKVSDDELQALRQRLTQGHVDDMMAKLLETSPHLRHDEDED